ncbi:MAG: hypothetical protein RBR30_05515 [Tenuifilaceae bacterium]|nr:hypothetical protein [Tenuifilaceae bacterium]
MKKLAFSLICFLAFSISGYANSEDALKQSISKIAQELESKYPGRGKVKVAILQFRTSDNRLLPFNQYIQDELNFLFRSSNRFEVIDQNAINRITEAYEWSLEMSNDFKNYSDLSEQIFRAIGMVPEVFIYGQINDRGDNISLTGYLVPSGLKSTNIYSTLLFPSSEVTDKLLGKPIRKPQPKPQQQPQVVVVEKPVYIEKEVVVEKPVYVDRPTPPAQPQGKFTGKIGDMEFELVKANNFGDRIEVEMSVVNNKSDDKIYYVNSRFIDPNGTEFESPYMHSTLRNRDLIEGIQIKGTITFQRGSFQNVTSMAVIEIQVVGDGNKQLGTLRFRGVPIEQ